MKIEWVDGFKIHIKNENGTVVISANKEGLESLAKQLTAMAESETGCHIHYDSYNSLEDGSVEMILEKID